MANPEMARPEGMDRQLGKSPETSKAEPIKTEKTENTAALLNERQAAHDRVLKLDQQIKDASDDSLKTALTAERKQIVSRIMEINADFASEGKDVPPAHESHRAWHASNGRHDN